MNKMNDEVPDPEKTRETRTPPPIPPTPHISPSPADGPTRFILGDFPGNSPTRQARQLGLRHTSSLLCRRHRRRRGIGRLPVLAPLLQHPRRRGLIGAP